MSNGIKEPSDWQLVMDLKQFIRFIKKKQAH